MKYRIDRQSWQDMLKILTIIIIAILFYKFMDNVDAPFQFAGDKLQAIWGVITPFIYAALFAYILSPVVAFAEEHFLERIIVKDRFPAMKRVIATLLVYLILTALISGAIVYILPEIIKSITDLLNSVPGFAASIEDWLNQMNRNVYSDDASFFAVKSVELLNELFRTLGNETAEIANAAILAALGLAGNIVVFVFAAIISAYMIISQEYWIKGSRTIVNALFGRKALVRYELFWRKMNRTFIKFILGKAIASLIMGVLCFMILIILNAPYALFISVIFGITNMIPYLGPLIGEILGGLIVAMVDPLLGLWVFLLLMGLQQFDAFLFTPKLVGNALRISPVWVIFAILLGGQLFGIIGMLFASPLMAVIMDILDHYIRKRLKNRSNPYPKDQNCYISPRNISSK